MEDQEKTVDETDVIENHIALDEADEQLLDDYSVLVSAEYLVC